MFVCCECRVLSGRGLCDELITRPEESYRLCCVLVCDLQTSCMRRSWPTRGGGGGRAVAPKTNKQEQTNIKFAAFITQSLLLFNLLAPEFHI